MKRLVGACLLAIASTSLLAVDAHAPTDAELAQLPPYCAKRWKGTLSQEELANFPHGHHYCSGLKFLNRAQRSRAAEDRKFNLQSAQGEFSYVLQHLSKSHWMYPQVQTEMGHTLLKSKDTGAALNIFNQALASSPAYEPAYAGLIEALQRTGSKSSVLEVATIGLKHLPDSRYLKKIYLESGGKEPFPAPISGSTPTPEVASSKTIQESSEDPVGSDVETRSAREDSAVSNPMESPDSGCRFCPPQEIQKRWRDSFGEPVKQ